MNRSQSGISNNNFFPFAIVMFLHYQGKCIAESCMMED